MIFTKKYWFLFHANKIDTFCLNLKNIFCGIKILESKTL